MTPTPTTTPTTTPTATPTSTPTVTTSPAVETFGFSETAVAQITANFGTVEEFLRLRNQGQI